MARGMSVHVGVNKADPSFQMAELRGCVNDATAMSQIAIAHGFEQLGVFLDQGARFEPVKQAILTAAEALEKGDIFLLTFSGHGSTAPTSEDEDDGQDETILLHDCILIDNYIRRNLWSQFKEGVRILGVADCCHSGTALFANNLGNPLQPITSNLASVAAILAVPSLHTPAPQLADALMEAVGAEPRNRELTKADRKRIIATSPDIHDQIANEIISEGKSDIQATLLTLAAGNDFELARDGDDNGAFTKAMLEVLRDQDAPENYDEFMTRITKNLKDKHITQQHPTRYPKEQPDLTFLGQPPFTI